MEKANKNQFIGSNKSVFRPAGNLVEGFTVIPNSIMNNVNIMTPDAFTVLAKILQYINNPEHKISIRGLSTQTGLTKDRVSKGIHKLIDVGFIVRTPIKNGNLTNGYIYEIFDTPQTTNVADTKVYRNPEIKDTETKDTEIPYGNKENNNKQNNKKENKVVVVSEKEQQLLDMYKSFKLEKRVRPQTTNLVLSYMNNFTLEVFEQVFIDASEDKVASKYRYLQDTFAKLAAKGVKTLKDFDKDRQAFKDSVKASKQTTKKTTSKPTKSHNINQTFMKYTPEELEKMLLDQQDKHTTNESVPTNVTVVEAANEKPKENTGGFIPNFTPTWE